MIWWKFWERAGQSILDIAAIEREQRQARHEQEKAFRNATELGIEADQVRSDLKRHREQNHFSELVAHVLSQRGEGE